MVKQKYINVVVGSLDTPNETFLIECLPLESSSNVYSSIILHTMDDVLRQLGTKRENFGLLLTDAAQYMSLPGKTFKESRVRVFFENLDNVSDHSKGSNTQTKIAKIVFVNLVCHHLWTL